MVGRPALVPPAQLAELLQVELEVVVELAEKEELPGRKVGEEWRFSREAILAWLAEEE
jgi:excisionase family DNA binding protein